MRIEIVQKRQFLNIIFTAIYIYIAYTVFIPLLSYFDEVFFGYQPRICPEIAFCIPSQIDILRFVAHIFILFIVYLLLIKLLNKARFLRKISNK